MCNAGWLLKCIFKTQFWLQHNSQLRTLFSVAKCLFCSVLICSVPDEQLTRCQLIMQMGRNRYTEDCSTWSLGLALHIVIFPYLVLLFVFVTNLHDFLLLLLNRCSIPPLCHCLTGSEKTHFWQILFHIESKRYALVPSESVHLLHGHCPDCQHVSANPAFLQNTVLPGKTQSSKTTNISFSPCWTSQQQLQVSAFLSSRQSLL